jgi:YVTN family beta-propeller protein
VATISGKRFGFDAPAAIVSVGQDLFVANSRDNTVSEFSAARRQHIRTINGAGYGFADPIALASSGQDLFVLNGAGSLTELATATGALIGTASGSTFGFDDPTGLAVADGDIFVANSAADSVTVVDASTLAFVASLSGSTFAFSTPIGVAFDGTNVWVTNQGDESVTEFSPTTLTELTVLVSWNLPMAGPITYGNGYVFAVSPPGSSPMVSQISTTPAVVNWMMCNTNGPYLFNNPEAVVVVGSNLWVVNEGGNSLTEMDTVTGNLIRTVANP